MKKSGIKHKSTSQCTREQWLKDAHGNDDAEREKAFDHIRSEARDEAIDEISKDAIYIDALKSVLNTLPPKPPKKWNSKELLSEARKLVRTIRERLKAFEK
jgi:hypothetical protein